MTSNEQRSEVAARLRYVAEHGAPEWETIACCIADCLGENDYPLWENGDKLFDLLVNLIEPEPERTCTFSVKEKDGDPYPTCSECGYETDFGELIWYFDNTLKYENKYCPNCGAKVVGND